MSIHVVDDDCEGEIEAERFFEIIDGQRIQIPAPTNHACMLRSELSCLIYGYVKRNGDFGMPVTGMLFRLPIEKTPCRRAGVAFVPYARWKKNRVLPEADYWDVVPTLCVEIPGPKERFISMTRKILDYFEAGVNSVWVIHSNLGILQVYSPDLSCRAYDRTATLDGGEIIPGFQLKLSELFPEDDGEAIS